MGKIGNFGNVQFMVKRDESGMKVQSFSDLTAHYSANYGEHKRQKNVPYIEYDSLNAREFNLSIYSDMSMGFDPRKIRRYLWKDMKKGQPRLLVIGGGNISSNKLVITDMDVTYAQFTPDGLQQKIKIDLTLKEWIKKKKTKKKKKPSGSKKKNYTWYVTKKGDTLFKIAKKFYGDGKKWKKIYNANKNVLSNTKPPRAGIKLKIPKIKKKDNWKDHIVG